MKLEKHSSGIAKAGLATAIPAATASLINLLGGTNLFNQNHPECNEDHVVDRYTMDLKFQIAEKDTQIALRDANTFTDKKIADVYERSERRFRDIEDKLCKQAITNQKTSDTFQLVSERLQCCCESLGEKISSECKERKCADNSIVNYVNSVFYPKQVADVETGKSTTPQVLFNPLPTDCCDC